MSLTINTNLSSLIVQKSLLNSTNGLNQAIERMTTGFKINHAKDNAAGYSISLNMGSKLSSYDVALDNATMGLDMVSTASESLDLINDRLARLRALTEQAANGTYGADSIAAMKKEADAIVSEIERTMANTEYNGIKLFGDKTPEINGVKIETNSDGFIKDVVHRDTSTMTSVADLDPTQDVTSGTYSISTKEELIKLAEMGKSGSSKLKGGEFVLANDIDMSGVNWEYIFEFSGTFDGNGYKISNLSDCLFSVITNAQIKNLGLENVSIAELNSPLTPGAISSNIVNCYATGSITGSSYFFGGLVGYMTGGGSIDSCWSDVDINAEAGAIGGIVGLMEGGTISNTFSVGSVVNNLVDVNTGIAAVAGGIVGAASDAGVGNVYSPVTIENCYTSSKVSSADNVYVGTILGSNGGGALGAEYDVTISNVTYDATINPDIKAYSGTGNKIIATNIIAKMPEEIGLQVGIDSSDSSRLSFTIGFGLSGLSSNIENIGMLDKIDKMLSTVSAKQTEFGAVQNRLESVIESIGINIENLTSSQSTIRDADIAEESSEYIRNQILQQAAATLLANANQTPSIALQLL